MYLQTVTPKTPAIFMGRLTEVERSMIRASENDDRLEYLRQVHFSSDCISEADMKVVHTTLMAEYAENSKSLVFGRTWNF